MEPLAARGRARLELGAEREEIRLRDARRDDRTDSSERHALRGDRRGQRCGSDGADEQEGLGGKAGHGCLAAPYRSFAFVWLRSERACSAQRPLVLAVCLSIRKSRFMPSALDAVAVLNALRGDSYKGWDAPLGRAGQVRSGGARFWHFAADRGSDARTPSSYL